MTLIVIAGVSLLALAGCGDKNAEGSSAVATQGAGAAGGHAGWSAADACSILDKAAVAEILKQPVADAQVSLVSEAGSATAATSECTYIGAEGGSIARLSARWSPINDNTPEAIATARSATAAAMKAFSDKPLEDVPGLGKAAFLAPQIDQLTVFIDDARMIVVTAEKVPNGASGKDIVMALAKKAGA
jgi:hypothetical protein